MKRLIFSYLLSLFCISMFNTTLYAEYLSNTCQPCEYSCNPLYCGACDIQVHAGVAPLLWVNREEFSLVNCPLSATNPIFALFDIPKFNTFFHIPWTVGGQVGYAWSDALRFYMELNYVQSGSKDTNALVTTNPAITPVQTFTFLLQKYRLFDAYLGIRYYWDRWCDRVSFFVGGKIGMTHHQKVNVSVTVTPPTPALVLLPTDTNFFRSNTVVSSGINLGLDICLYCNWSLVITGEVVASCGPSSNGNTVISPTLEVNPTNFLIGHIGTELRFPITAGIRYSF